MKRFRKPELPEDEAWLLTFADMSVLLMSFFILMFALSAPESKQMLNNVTASLRERGFYNDKLPVTDGIDDLKRELSLAIGEKGYDQFIAMTSTLHGVDVELAAGSFFEPGSAKFKSDALPMLDAVTRQIMPLARQDVTVEIVGHTDDSPIESEAFPSNWELSAARSANVVRYLIAKRFPAAKLRAVGVADTAPKAPNRDAEGNPLPANQNINRRVVVKIIRGEDN